MMRKGSRNPHYQRRIPLDVIDKARGMTLSLPIGDQIVLKKISDKANDIRVSLRTPDPTEYKARKATLDAYLEGFWRSIKDGPTALTHKQCVALAGELYGMWVSALEDYPGEPRTWEKVLANNEDAAAGRYGSGRVRIGDKAKVAASLEDRYGAFADLLLARHALIVDQKSRLRLLEQTHSGMNKAAVRVMGYAEGDYSEDTEAGKFPKFERTPSRAAKANPKVSLKGLLDGWWMAAKAAGQSESTKTSYTRAVTLLGEFLRHDDATRITPEDILAFRNHLRDTPDPVTGQILSPKTIKDSHLAGTKAVFNWAVSERLLDSNPATGITIKVGKKPKLRERYFRSEERKAILDAARAYTPIGHENAANTNAKKWVPWLCAYTGARVGEMVQLRSQDIRQQDGHWVLAITPEAGTVKTKEMRLVPVHEHLIEIGFTEFAKSQPSDYLFMTAKAGDDTSGKWNAAKNRVREFVRGIVPDKEIQPNHGWRHTFKTLAREAEGCDAKVCDDIVGHSASNVGDRYGESTIKARALFMSKFPRVI